MLDLERFMDESKQNTLSVAAERFERRLGEELGAVRVEMAREFSAVRVEAAREGAGLRAELATGFGAARVDLAATRAELLKWSFLVWIGQVAAVSAIMAFLLRALGPH